MQENKKLESKWQEIKREKKLEEGEHVLCIWLSLFNYRDLTLTLSLFSESKKRNENYKRKLREKLKNS